MSLWVYDIKQLLNLKNLLISNKSTLEQFFNFLTYIVLGVSYYLKKIKNDKWQIFLISSIVAVILLGIIFTYNNKKTEFIDGMEVPMLDTNYKFDLNVD